MSASLNEHYAQRGIRPISATEAFDVLEHGVRTPHPHLAVFHRPKREQGTSLSHEEMRSRIRAVIARAAGSSPEEITGQETFTELGIDSLVALDIVKDIEDVLGYGLPTTLLYEHDTLDGLMGALQSGVERSAPQEQRSDSLEGLPLLPTQHGFVIQHHFFPDMQCNVTLQIKVSGAGPLQPDPLARAVEALVQRHWILSQAVVLTSDQWRLCPSPQPVRLHVHDALDGLDLSNRRLDLSEGPLFEVHCDSQYILLLGHHVIVDAWSQKILMEDLVHLYAELLGHSLEALPRLRRSWEDVVQLSHDVNDSDLPWWREQLMVGIPPQHIPWQAPVSAPSSGGCSQHRHTLSLAHTEALQALASSAEVTLPALILGAWKQLIFSLTGQQRVTVRVAQGRRELRLPDILHLVGSFADSFPVITDLSAGDDLIHAARLTSQSLSEAQAHGAISSVALAGLGEFKACGPSGLTPFAFSFPLLPSETQIGHLELSDLTGAAGGGFTRLTLLAWVFRDQLHLTFNYARSHLSAPQVSGLMDRLTDALTEVLQPQEDRPEQLHSQVLLRCDMHPERPAVGTLSYGQLARRSAALAKRLDGPRIAVLATASEAAAIAMLAVMRTGAAWVPVDPNWPDQRIGQVLESADVSGLITTEAHLERIRGCYEGMIVTVGEEESEEGPHRDGELAYIMYTSGSTGAPKGVMVRHGVVLEWLSWVKATFISDENEQFAWTSSLSYGGTLRQLFAPLLSGGRSVPIPRCVLRDPDSLIKTMHAEKITVFNTVPSLMNHLLPALDRCDIEQPLKALKWVLVGGEAVTADLVRRFQDRFPHGVRFGNLYGSTETIVNATLYEVIDQLDAEERFTPIGWARAGVQVHLLDLSDGVGEVGVSGHIADGYWRDPEQTAQVFIDHPKYGRLYRTGDLARQLPDGSLVFLGRRDSQVQVHGNRVELSEVEHALCNFPGVEAAVVVYEGGYLSASIQSQEEIAADHLREYIATQLPSYMVPHKLSIMDSLPRNAAGKADRIQLRQVAQQEHIPRDANRLQVLADIWQRILDLPTPPKPEDNFFALGGDSMGALEILTALQERGLRLRPMAIYQHQELGAMADALLRLEARPSVDTAESSTTLSSVQRGFWTAHQRRPERPPLWAARIPLRGRVDVSSLQGALHQVVDRHEVLRSTFSAGRHGPEVRVHGRGVAQLTVQDLRLAPSDTAQKMVDLTWELEQHIAFSMETLPLFRVHLVQLSDAESMVFFSAHHIIADAWSCWVLMAELLALHENPHRRLAPATPYSAQLADVVQEDDGWWTRALADLPRHEPEVLNHIQDAQLRLEPAVWAAIQRSARALKMSPFVLCLSCVARAIQRVTGEDDLVIATALSGREERLEAVKGVVGPFARALPLRLRGEISPHGANQVFREASAHANVSMGSIARSVGSEALSLLGRYFLSWMDPSIFPLPAGELTLHWREGRFAFDTAATQTELMIGAVIDDGLQFNFHGGRWVHPVKEALEEELRQWTGAQASLLVYAPSDMPVPIQKAISVETIRTPHGAVELIGLPVNADQLQSVDLERLIGDSAPAINTPVVALAGMLPALTGLATRDLLPGKMLTTGHGVTVVAMYLNTRAILASLGWTWSELHVGVLGYGAIGQASLALCVDQFGEAAKVSICDPKVADGAVDLYECDLILGATSGGNTLDVGQLRPGTVVIDDSFPAAFSPEKARARMMDSHDVLLVGGGALDVGELSRWSPFPQADALRKQFGHRWLPGCLAEALLIGVRPELGMTVGIVSLPRSQALLEAVRALGWRAAPPHLGGWVVPNHVIQHIKTLTSEDTLT